MTNTIVDPTQAFMATQPAHPVRESPAPEPLHGGLADPAHQAVLDESVLNIDNIQGNILGGFNKDFQTFLFLQITDVTHFRHWLNGQVPFISTSAEVLAFNRLYKSIRYRRKHGASTIRATWLNIAFSYAAFSKLVSQIPSLLIVDFADAAFKNGLARQSPSLGDPVDPAQDGNAANWVVGGPNNEADIVLLIASDTYEDLCREVARVEDSIYIARNPDGNRTDSGVRVLFKQNGANLPGPLGGHEHFGFLDGISQPGLRGLLSSDKTSVLTLRQNPNKRDTVPPGGGVQATAQGKPGQDLLWPGEFVFGYPRQNATPDPTWDGPNPNPGLDSLRASGPNGGSAGPDWAQDGSFLVFRRLRQDVFAFHEFLRQNAEDSDVTTSFLGAKLVGRWPSGAPVVRVPNHDDNALGNDDCANNNFEFQSGSSNIAPALPNDPYACADSHQPASPGDKDGSRCPFTSHIRKMYPRDDVTVRQGAPTTSLYGVASPCGDSIAQLNESSTQTHRLLRRGIPYGEVSASTPNRPVQDTADRGLLFFAYQTSIERQFEFVTKCWANNQDFKEPFGAAADAPLARGGHDPIIGQNPNGSREFAYADENGVGYRLQTQANWVTPTGGGYFFSPSIQALKDVLSEAPPMRDADA